MGVRWARNYGPRGIAGFGGEMRGDWEAARLKALRKVRICFFWFRVLAIECCSSRPGFSYISCLGFVA